MDIDSTVITRFGKQKRVKKGYNARYKGRGSHHQLMAFIPELKVVANSWMRPGNSSSSSDFALFLEHTLEMVPKERIGLVRFFRLADNLTAVKLVGGSLRKKQGRVVLNLPGLYINT